MSNRFVHIQRLVNLRRWLARHPENTDTIMRAAIIDALPDQYRKVYDWIGSQYTPVTSPMVMRAWELNPNHASTILNELWQFGLLNRTEQTDEHGRRYVYEQTG